MVTFCCSLFACTGKSNVSFLQAALQKEMVILWIYVFQRPSQVHALMSNQGSVYAPLFILGKSTNSLSDLFSFLQSAWERQVFETSTVSSKFNQKQRMVETLRFLQTLLMQKPRINREGSSLRDR